MRRCRCLPRPRSLDQLNGDSGAGSFRLLPVACDQRGAVLEGDGRIDSIGPFDIKFGSEPPAGEGDFVIDLDEPYLVQPKKGFDRHGSGMEGTCSAGYRAGDFG